MCRFSVVVAWYGFPPHIHTIVLIRVNTDTNQLHHNNKRTDLVRSVNLGLKFVPRLANKCMFHLLFNIMLCLNLREQESDHHTLVCLNCKTTP